MKCVRYADLCARASRAWSPPARWSTGAPFRWVIPSSQSSNVAG